MVHHDIRILLNYFSGGPFELTIPGSSEYTTLPLTRLDGICQIVRRDGAVLPDDVDFSIVNLFSHEIFSQVDVVIDDFNLSSHNNLYAYKSYLQTLLSYAADANLTQLTTSLFVRDSAYNFEAGVKDMLNLEKK